MLSFVPTLEVAIALLQSVYRLATEQTMQLNLVFNFLLCDPQFPVLITMNIRFAVVLTSTFTDISEEYRASSLALLFDTAAESSTLVRNVY
jgi:hypothetical protein